MHAVMNKDGGTNEHNPDHNTIVCHICPEQGILEV
jgi:hypothetical protein